MDNKITDNDIIKALKCCINEDFQECEKCPLCIQNEPCRKTKLPTIALDLINRQQAEVERLLQKLQQPQSEAVKEFADRLKCNASILCDKVTGYLVLILFQIITLIDSYKKWWVSKCYIR